MTNTNHPKTPQNPTPASDLGQMPGNPCDVKAKAILNGWWATISNGMLPGTDYAMAPNLCAIDLAYLLAMLTSSDKYQREAAKRKVRELVKAGSVS